MNMDVHILNQIEEMAAILDIGTGKLLFANDRLRVCFQTEESMENLSRRLLKDCKKNKTVIQNHSSFISFTLSQQESEAGVQLVAIGKYVDQNRVGLEGLEAENEVSESYRLLDQIMQIKENTVSHIMEGKNSKWASNLDALTGLPNKHYFIELTRKILENDSIQDEFVIVYFNIDRFQTYNDTYGFEVGDEFLKSVVKVLMEEFEYYLEARYSDDHFVVLTSRVGLLDKIKRVHQRVHNLQQDVVMEIKAGIYENLNADTPISMACDWAKLACDSIKYNYNEDYRFYDASLREQLLKEKYIIDHIDEAIENQYLKVYYQPVVRVLSNQVCGMESLVRWIDPERGFLSPGEFIPILEKHRLISKVDQFVMEQVCKDFQFYRDKGLPLVPASINLSRLDFQLMDVCKEINAVVEKYAVDKQLIHLEVTESALNDDAEKLCQVIDQLQKEGYEVWLDDFGSEYSSLNTLQNFHFDVLKIDMKFFDTFQTNEASKTIILSIVDMAKRLKMRTVAEGVETREQMMFLKELGCDIAQGYYCYRPNPIEELRKQIPGVETPEERQYFDELSKINLLSPEPVEHAGDKLEMFFTAPTAIVQLKDGYIQFLFSNNRYLESIRGIGMESMEEIERTINNKEARIYYKLMDMAESCTVGNAVQSVDFIHNGNHCNINIQEVARNGDTRAFFTTLINLNVMSMENKKTIREQSMAFLYSIYNRIDLIDVMTDRIDNIYLNALYYKTALNGDKIEASLQEFTRNNILEEDQQSFQEFYDIRTLKRRIEDYGKGYVVKTFRTKTRKNQYVIQFYVIIQAGNHQEERYLSCVRDLSMDLAREFMKKYKDTDILH